MLNFNQYNDVVRQRSLLVDNLPEGFFFAEDLADPLERFRGGVLRLRRLLPREGVEGVFYFRHMADIRAIAADSGVPAIPIGRGISLSAGCFSLTRLRVGKLFLLLL